MDKQERVVCAAVRFSNNGNHEDVMCINYDDSRVNDVRGHNLEWGIIPDELKGFITNKNRFVDPVEAQKIAIASGQYDCPNKKIARLEEAIEDRRFEIEHARNNMVFNRLQSYNKTDREAIRKLSAGYLGYELRVEDLY